MTKRMEVNHEGSEKIQRSTNLKWEIQSRKTKGSNTIYSSIINSKWVLQYVSNKHVYSKPITDT